MTQDLEQRFNKVIAHLERNKQPGAVKELREIFAELAKPRAEVPSEAFVSPSAMHTEVMEMLDKIHSGLQDLAGHWGELQRKLAKGLAAGVR